MEETRFSYLFNRYFHNLATAEELNEFFVLAKSEKQSTELTRLMANHWESFEVGENPFDQLAKERMLSAIYKSGEVKAKPVSIKFWPKIAIAAAVAGVVLAAGIVFFKGGSDRQEMPVAYLNDVSPGRQGATLTLASGKTIKLTDAKPGKLADEASVAITKTAAGQLAYEIKESDSKTKNINTLSTGNGETYQLRLPDGTLVWLNSASSLTYAANLTTGGKRRVILSGEGYFEVAKDRFHPFIVQTRGQQVEVLGTHFNISSYADESSIKTTLLEGSIRVNDQVTLKPNEEAVLKGNQLNIRPADINATIDWIKGDFIFKRESLEQIMREVTRWYDVEVSYDPAVDIRQTFSGQVSRSKNISQVLQSIESTGKLKFKIDKRHVFVFK